MSLSVPEPGKAGLLLWAIWRRPAWRQSLPPYVADLQHLPGNWALEPWKSQFRIASNPPNR
jgi:hypothetical protein